MITRDLQAIADELRLLASVHAAPSQRQLVTWVTRLDDIATQLSDMTVFEPHIVDLTRAFAVIQGGLS